MTEHGEHTHAPSEKGDKGDKGDRGKTGTPPLLVRHATAAYVILLCGVVLAVASVVNVNDNARERDKAKAEIAKIESVETDKALCSLAQYFGKIANENREGIRSLDAVFRQLFRMVVPAPSASPEEVEQTNNFRERAFDLLDDVKLKGDVPPINCEGIGDGSINFSVPEALRQAEGQTPP